MHFRCGQSPPTRSVMRSFGALACLVAVCAQCACTEAPGNDDCANPCQLSLENGVLALAGPNVNPEDPCSLTFIDDRRPNTLGFNTYPATSDSDPEKDTDPRFLGTSACGAPGHDIWYAFIPRVDGVLEVELCGSGFDTMVEIYESTRCEKEFPYQALACGDDYCDRDPRIVFPVRGLRPYSIRVGGFKDDRGFGLMRLDFREDARPGTENCFTRHDDSAGCSLPDCRERVCSEPGFATCCTDGWVLDCAARARQVCECQTESDCDDGLECTGDVCVEGTCHLDLDSRACDDGLFCDGIEVCNPFSGCESVRSPCGPDETCDENSRTCRSRE